MSCTRDDFSAKISLKEHFWRDLIGVWKITLLTKDPVSSIILKANNNKLIKKKSTKLFCINLWVWLWLKQVPSSTCCVVQCHEWLDCPYKKICKQIGQLASQPATTSTDVLSQNLSKGTSAYTPRGRTRLGNPAQWSTITIGKLGLAGW